MNANIENEKREVIAMASIAIVALIGVALVGAMVAIVNKDTSNAAPKQAHAAQHKANKMN